MDREHHYCPCGMSRQHTKTFVQEKLRNQFHKTVPPVPILCKQHLPTQFGPANMKHPLSSDINNYIHGTGTVAMVATLIIPTIWKLTQSPKRAKTAANVQQWSKKTRGQRGPTCKWLSILTFMTIAICLIHRYIYVNTQQHHYNNLLSDVGHGIPVLLGTENVDSNESFQWMEVTAIDSSGKMTSIFLPTADPPEQHSARGPPFHRDQLGQNQYAVPGLGTEVPIPKSSVREARHNRCD